MVVTATGAGQRIYVVVVALAFEKLVTFVASMLKTPVLENLTDSAFAADVPITPIAVYRTPPSLGAHPKPAIHDHLKTGQ